MNGPDAITRVLKKFCKTKKSKITTDCDNFHLLPREICYAIGWKEWKLFFKEKEANNVKKRLENSHFVHLWNKHSSNYKIQLDSKAAFIELAENFCPKVFYTRRNFF
jgi:lactosylceramide 4-alpha-galactosyltransferase